MAHNLYNNSQAQNQVQVEEPNLATSEIEKARAIKTAETAYKTSTSMNFGEARRSHYEVAKQDSDLTDFKKMFEKNETMMDRMTEDIMSLKEIMSAQNKLELFERILLSAKMVKTVLLRNMELNKDYMDHTLEIDDLQKQVQQLQIENEDIRDRLSIMEALTGTDSYYIATNYSTIKEAMPAELPRNQKDLLSLLDQDKMIALIYEYNKENIILKKRIERMEKKRITNNFIQMSDVMGSTAYTSNPTALVKTVYGSEQRRKSKDVGKPSDQMYHFNARCSTSPKLIPDKDIDSEPIR